MKSTKCFSPLLTAEVIFVLGMVVVPAVDVVDACVRFGLYGVIKDEIAGGIGCGIFMLSQHGFNQLPLFFGGECFTVQKAGDAVMVDAPLQQIGKSCGGGLPKTCNEVVAVEFYHVFVHLFTLADHFFCYDSAFLKGCVTSVI